MTTLEDLAVELYGLPPGEFTAARDAHAKQARSGGDRELAKAIGGLRKPSVAAWAVNLLVREHPDEVAQLLTLGGLLREAQAALAGDDLRTLNRQQHTVMAAVVRQATALTARRGQKLSDPVALQVEGTLRAAMADREAADAVLSGLLVRNLESTGFEPVDVSGAVAVSDTEPILDVALSPARLRAVPDAPAEPATAAGPRSKKSAGARAGGRAEAAQHGDAAEEAAQAEKAREAEEARRAEQAEARRRAEAARRRAEAEQDLRTAEQDDVEAKAALEAAEARSAELEDRRRHVAHRAEETARQIEELTARAAALADEARSTAREAKGARAAQESAARVAAAAARRVEVTRERLDTL